MIYKVELKNYRLYTKDSNSKSDILIPLRLSGGEEIMVRENA